MLKWVMAAALAVALPAVASAADIEAGKAVFKKCAACHQIGEGAQNAAGPNLTCVIGSVSGGHSEGYAYSEALKNAKKTWDEATIDAWVQGPSKVIPGTKMIFPAGVKDPTDRENLIAYIKSECKK